MLGERFYVKHACFLAAWVTVSVLLEYTVHLQPGLTTTNSSCSLTKARLSKEAKAQLRQIIARFNQVFNQVESHPLTPDQPIIDNHCCQCSRRSLSVLERFSSFAHNTNPDLCIDAAAAGGPLYQDCNGTFSSDYARRRSVVYHLTTWLQCGKLQ